MLLWEKKRFLLVEAVSIQIHPQLSHEGSFSAHVSGVSLRPSRAPARCQLRCPRGCRPQSGGDKPTEQLHGKDRAPAWHGWRTRETLAFLEKLLALFIPPSDTEREKNNHDFQDAKALLHRWV